MNKLEAAARQALDALIRTNADEHREGPFAYRENVITALREALAEQATEQRPQNCGTGFCSCIECPYGTQQAAKQEPQCLPDGIRYKLPPLKLTGHQIMHLASIARDADALDAVWCIKELPPLSAMEPEGPCTGGIAATTEGQPGWALLNAAPTQQPLTDDAKDAKDAERYRWLKSRMMGADLDWNESGACALVFEWPRDVPIGADCDRNIDNAVEAAHGITSKEGGAA